MLPVPLDPRRNPGFLKLDLLCRGARLAEPSRVEREGGRPVLRTRAGLGSGLEIVLPGRLHVNVPVVEPFAARSPYEIRLGANGRLEIRRDGTPCLPARLAPRPAWYDLPTSRGRPMRRVGTLQGTYLAIYPGRTCDFWVRSPARPARENCRFCSVGLNLGADDADDKTVDEVLEVVRAARRESAITYVDFNAGHADDFGAPDALEPYVRRVKRETGLLVGVQAPPHPDPDRWARLREAGLNRASFCLEIWDPERFRETCPGKARVYGQAAYLDAIERCVEVGRRVRRGLEPWIVNGEIVAGLEPPASSIEAIDAIVERGAVPTVCVFRPLLGTDLAKADPPETEEMVPVFERLWLRCMERGFPIGAAPNVHVSLVLLPEEARWLVRDPAALRRHRSRERRIGWLRRGTGALLRARTSWKAVATALLVAALAGCGREGDGRGDSAPSAGPSAEVLVARDVAAAYFGEDQVSEAREALRPLVERADAVPEDLLRAAVVEIGEGFVDDGERFLRRFAEREPDAPALHYNLARIARHRGDFEASLAHLRRCHALAPKDLPTALALADILRLLDRPDEALPVYREILDVGVDHGGTWYMSALVQTSLIHYRAGRTAEAEAAKREFDRLTEKGMKIAAANDADRGTFGLLATPRPAGVVDARPRPPRFSEPSVVGADTARASGAIAAALVEEPPSGVAPGDVVSTRAGLPDLVAWGGGGVVVARRSAAGGWSSARALDEPCSLLRTLDLDGDGTLDLLVVSDGRLRLLGAHEGGWRDRDVAFPSLPSAPEDVEVVDFDHEGDLDLVLAGPFGSRLWRNDGALVPPSGGSAGPRGGRFEDVTESAGLPRDRPFSWCVAEDFDGDKDVDLLFGGAGGCHLADDLRMGRFGDRSADLGPVVAPGRFPGRPVVADLDADGRPDVWIPGEGGLLLLGRPSGRFERRASPPPEGSVAGALDLDLDGALDAVLASPGGLARARLALVAADAPVVDLPGTGGALALSDLDGDGGADLVRAGPGGFEVRRGERPAAGTALRVVLRGVKDNRRAVGAIVEVRAGALYRRAFYRGDPVVFALGARGRADVVRVTWPNGVVQGTTNVSPASECLVVQREGHNWSCPFLWSWDGTAWRFAGDVLGHAPLGLTWPGLPEGPPDGDERVVVPGLAPLDGAYEVRITEELREAAYLDALVLEVVDHPEGTRVVPNERAGPSPAGPAWHLVEPLLAPESASGADGSDVSSALASDDGWLAAPPRPLRGALRGLAERHAVEARFDPRALVGARRLRLVLSGALETPDADVLAAARGAGVPVLLPVLSVSDGAGGWRRVGDTIGFPASRTKAQVVDLTGVLPRDDPRVRVETTLAIAWDSWGLATDAGDAPASVRTLRPSSARTWRRGFSATLGVGRSWDRLDPDLAHDGPAGLYTRLGDVTDLLESPDDRPLVLAPGDALAVRFAGGAPPPRAGLRRTALLLVHGWTKEAVTNARSSSTVEPLPRRGARYPEAAAGGLPAEWRASWLTRAPEPWFESLTAGRPSTR